MAEKVLGQVGREAARFWPGSLQPATRVVSNCGASVVATMRLSIAIWILVVIAGVATLSVAVRTQWYDQGGDQRRAVIIDQLGLTDPNPGFLRAATLDLTNAGYEVEYVDWRAVSVEFFRRLPERNYSFVIIRSHSAVSPGDAESVGSAEEQDMLSLFTSEPYAEGRYIDDQYARAVNRVRLESPQREQAFFGVTSQFVRDGMDGPLRGADVLLMGCDGMRGLDMALALQDRGAGSVVGWDGPVSARHTDRVTRRLIELVASEEYAIGDATKQAMVEFGPDPEHHSRLVVSP